MELTDGDGFAALVAAAAAAESAAEGDDGRADGEAGDNTVMPGLHAELSYQRPYPSRFAANVEIFCTFECATRPHTAESAVKNVSI